MEDETKDKDEQTQETQHHDDKRLTWTELMERNIKSNWEVGEEFTLQESYDRFLESFRKRYPENKNLEATMRDVLQTLRDENMLVFKGERGDPNAGHYQRIA